MLDFDQKKRTRKEDSQLKTGIIIILLVAMTLIILIMNGLLD